MNSLYDNSSPVKEDYLEPRRYFVEILVGVLTIILHSRVKILCVQISKFGRKGKDPKDWARLKVRWGKKGQRLDDDIRQVAELVVLLKIGLSL